MDHNLASFGASLDGKELYVLPGLKSLIIRDGGYGYTTVVPAVMESGHHVLAVSHYGSNEESNRIIESGLKDIGEAAGRTHLREASFVKVSVFRPAMRTPASMTRLKEFLAGAGFGGKLDTLSMVEASPESAMGLDVPVSNPKPISETIQRGLKAQDEAVMMSLRLTCEGAKSLSFDIHNMLHGKDAIGYPLPFVVSRMALESGTSEKLQKVAQEALIERFGDNLIRCTVTPEDGLPVLEYAVQVSPDAVKLLSEQTYPTFNADSQHNCIHVVEFRTKDKIDGELAERIEAACQASAVGVNFEVLEGEMGMRIGFPAYSRLPANTSEDIQKRVSFIESLLRDVSVADTLVHKTVDFTTENVKKTHKANGEYARLSKVEASNFAYARLVGSKTVSQKLAAGRLGAPVNGAWYFESNVPGHILSLVQEDSGKVMVGYFVEKGSTEDRPSARAEAKRLLSLV